MSLSCKSHILRVGLIGVMLTLNVFYEIPQLNLGQLFVEKPTNFGESEKLRSTTNPCYSGPGHYMPQRDDEIRAIVRIRPHANNDDSPSPEDPTPMHAKDVPRIP